ncbi:hypothetical protein TNCV_2937971 [Trichonephila clavipes]|nr:hypothetical protein TNCV_2937971 [Trichonephila clavipes]
MVPNSWPTCHELLAKVLLKTRHVERLMHIKSLKTRRHPFPSPMGVVWQLGERMVPPQVSLSLLDHGSKLWNPLPIAFVLLYSTMLTNIHSLEATKRLLTVNLAKLNYDQVTRSTAELAPHCINFHTMQMGEL